MNWARACWSGRASGHIGNGVCVRVCVKCDKVHCDVYAHFTMLCVGNQVHPFNVVCEATSKIEPLAESDSKPRAANDLGNVDNGKSTELQWEEAETRSMLLAEIPLFDKWKLEKNKMGKISTFAGTHIPSTLIR